SRIATLWGAVAALAMAAAVLYSTRGERLALAADGARTKPLVEFTPNGELIQPTGYRRWVYIGTPLTPNDLNDGMATFPEFHNVYMDPESFDYFEKTGQYRDGTVLIKELTSVGAKKATSGNGYFEGEFTGLEASIKDSKRFKEDPGHWGYFSFGHEYPLKETAMRNAVAACNDCHAKNAAGDFVFSQYYPVLRWAAGRNK